ncbi:SET domain-containing protein [Violaceomyces palustris]|uniref:SET domain-containing protein n=1 Tax=Violaceomyces palustris TaxID=1673888 RepID=A0ACD0NXK4_9BASI|nr:SET domain-containing protein [Violaceomyces palustris]
MQGGEPVTPESLPEQADEDAAESDVHFSGSARTEGFYRIPPAEKAAHLPDRNKAIVDTSNTSALASARDNRADSRRLVLGIEQHKKDTATDTDILKFNQLRTRKKQLKFAKSPIHDWGLYAMELIPAGDMVIEYVGEVIRQQVADAREKAYERQGNFSTYLFRVDDDLVVDATRKGNIARLMNHCCTPNCNAKILTLNGEKRIVLFAKNTILPGQELTYDYKFQSSADDENAITCLCGSPGCRRFL